MPRVMFVTGSLAHGGAERHAITLINRLAERGHDCHAVYVKSDAGQLDRMRLGDGGSVKCLSAARYFDRRALADFAAHIGRIRPEVIVATNTYALMYSRLALRFSGVTAVLAVTFHTTLLPNAKEWLQMLYYRPFFWTVDCLVFICEAQRRHWLRRLVTAPRNEMIYNGVDLRHWRPWSAGDRAARRAALGFAANDLVIGMCALFRPEKNHLQLIEAIGALRGRGIAARALLIGDGEMRPAIEARARELGLSDAVLITGLQKDVRPFLAASDTVVLCSQTVETFSLAALEAMALGLPVVLSEIGGAAEMVRPGGNGFLFPVGDTGALVDRLVQLVDPRERERMGNHARARVEALFSETTMVDSYERLLADLCRVRPEADAASLRA
ncbi:MAG: glycosyltransferase family 4 protein [Prolixibacteraceae bacterium]|nr:glycosyltransferase family 4 protein [Burkholderiales bacterium]